MFPYGILIIIIGIGFLRWMQMFPYGILIIIIGIGIGIAAVITRKKKPITSKVDFRSRRCITIAPL